MAVVHARIDIFTKFLVEQAAERDARSFAKEVGVLLRQQLGNGTTDEVIDFISYCKKRDIDPVDHVPVEHRAFVKGIVGSANSEPVAVEPLVQHVVEIDPSMLSEDEFNEWAETAPPEDVASFAWKGPGSPCPHCEKTHDDLGNLAVNYVVTKDEDGTRQIWACDVCRTDERRYANDIKRQRLEEIEAESVEA